MCILKTRGLCRLMGFDLDCLRPKKSNNTRKAKQKGNSVIIHTGLVRRGSRKFFQGGPTLSKIDSVRCITVEVHKYEK